MFARETIRKHAKILTDFANADNTDEACLTYFKNIKDFLHFSSKFEARIKKVFPFLNSFHKSLNQIEHKGLELISENADLMGPLITKLQVLPYRSFHDFDLKNKTLLLSYDIEDEPFWIPLDELKDENDHYLAPELLEDISKYMEVYDGLNKVQSEISENRFKELIDLCDDHHDIHLLHSRIKKIQNDYQNILKMVIQGKSLHDIPKLDEFMEIYYEMPTTKLKTKRDYLEEVPQIDEANYSRINYLDDSCDIFQNEFAFLMVEFFKGQNNRHYLRECQQCKGFYVSKTLVPSKYCSDKCRMAFHNQKRIKSGEAKEYKRKKRLEGAKESYYG